MSLVNYDDVMETISMIQEENLDIRTTTMGISLIDCADTDIGRSCKKIYDKICRLAENLVSKADSISNELGIPMNFFFIS